MNTDYQFDKEDIYQLNTFLRGELSAVETYGQAIEMFQREDEEKPAVVEALQRCQRSHQERAGELTKYVRTLGGEPASSSGAWGAFVNVVEGAATVIGESATLSALGEGEQLGLRNYRNNLEDLSESVRRFVAHRMIPEQERTHDALNRVQHSL